MESRKVDIHPTAIVDKAATLGLGVKIGPYSIVGPKVVLDDDVAVSSHVVISGRTFIGRRTRIWPFASIGTEPQDLKYKGEDAELICGTDNMFREYSNISIGTDGGGGKTVIGNGNLLMVNTHIAHDCIVHDNCIFANGASLGGHIEVGSRAVLGGHVGVHQFTRIGAVAMIGGGSAVTQDVPPYVLVHGNHASPTGINIVGLKRAGLDKEEIACIKEMYKILYSSNLTLEDTIEQITKSVRNSTVTDVFLTFLRNSKRGICR